MRKKIELKQNPLQGIDNIPCGIIGSMGIEFRREYDLIIRELMDAVQKIEGFYEFFEMDQESWKALGKEEKIDCIRVMSNDVFYGLGGQLETKPTTAGPAEHPRSPARARNANIAVPPLGQLAAARLKLPGHIMPTDSPQRAQPIIARMG